MVETKFKTFASKCTFEVPVATIKFVLQRFHESVIAQAFSSCKFKFDWTVAAVVVVAAAAVQHQEFEFF